MTEEVIAELEEVGCFPKGKGRPSRGETVPKPEMKKLSSSKISSCAVFAF